jgi:hypothetical protein
VVGCLFLVWNSAFGEAISVSWNLRDFLRREGRYPVYSQADVISARQPTRSGSVRPANKSLSDTGKGDGSSFVVAHDRRQLNWGGPTLQQRPGMAFDRASAVDRSDSSGKAGAS